VRALRADGGQRVPSANPFQYSGRENDGTGLYYYRARYYHPKLMRFVSEDPLRGRRLGGVMLPSYVYASKCDRGLSDCGRTLPRPWGSNSTRLGPSAMSDACGPLGSTILHEAVHRTDWWVSGEKKPAAREFVITDREHVTFRRRFSDKEFSITDATQPATHQPGRHQAAPAGLRRSRLNSEAITRRRNSSRSRSITLRELEEGEQLLATLLQAPDDPRALRPPLPLEGPRGGGRCEEE